MEALTLVIETELATRARHVAQQSHTTVDLLVTEFLSGLTDDETASHQEAAARLMATIDELSRPMGGKLWSNRDELHDRSTALLKRTSENVDDPHNNARLGVDASGSE